MYEPQGVSILGVTKAVLGAPRVARVLVENGITALGDSRIENIRTMRESRIRADFTLIRSPMPSETQSVVEWADTSLNSELDVISLLSHHAERRGKRRGDRHKIILMVELGDMREGIMPSELGATVEGIVALPGVELVGLGTNLGCFAGAPTTDCAMGRLAEMSTSVRDTFGLALEVVSGANSSGFEWFGSTRSPQLINQIRLGESIFLGRETRQGNKIPGLFTDAFTLVAEVIELKRKPHGPAKNAGRDAFGRIAGLEDRGTIRQALLGIGKQDVDPGGITPRIHVEVLGATSDHLVLDAGDTRLDVGSEVEFDVAYSALLRSMSSPYVDKTYTPAAREDPGRHVLTP